MPKVSVIISIFNSGNYLRNCLESVLNQTLKDIEVICVDDGSTDDSLDILQSYLDRDSRIRVYANSHRGVGATKDYGMYQATGDYIAFCDSDDEMPLDSLSKLYEKALCEQADVVVGNYEQVYVKNNVREQVNIYKEGASPFWLIFKSIILCNKLFSRNFIFGNDLHISDMEQSEDRVFMTNLFLCNPRVAQINNVIYYWMRREKAAQPSLSYRFIDQDYFDRIGSWYYCIHKLLNSGYKEANQRLIESANYLKRLYMDFTEEEEKKEAFEAIQKLMCRADWSQDYETFRKIWGVSYSDFARTTFEKYHGIETENGETNTMTGKTCSTPKVSVIIPCYNSAKYLKECMDSVLNQTLSEIEIICVDDGSTDETLNILNTYAVADQRVTVLHQENKFAGAARNLGMSHAKGEYLIFLDSDDFFDRNMLKLAYSRAKEDQADVVVFSAYNYQSETGKLIDAPWLLNTSYLPKYRPFSRRDIPQHIFSFVSTPPWNKLFRREFISQVGLKFQTTQRMNDIFFVMTAIALAERITTLNQKLLFYRVDIPESLQGTMSKTPTDVFFALGEVQKALLSNDIYEDLEQSFVNLCIRNLVFVLDSLKTGKAFEEFYTLMRDQYFNTLRIVDRPKDYFYREYYYWRYREIATKTATEYLFDKLSKANLELTRKTATNNKNHNNYDQVINSHSYKIGCAITWLPRKVIRGIRCYKENGFKYTWRLFWGKVKNKLKVKKKKKSKNKIIAKVTHYGLTRVKRSPMIIVSLTSFPARIKTVHKAIITLLSQTVKPDRVILWLAEEEFPQKEKQLPKELLKLIKYGLTIRWCENIKSYKKLIPALREYPDDIIVTADDDAYYEKDWLERLYNAYLENPCYIHCHRITKFYINNGEFNWVPAGKSSYPLPSYLHKLVGLGGVLYPPHSLADEVIKSNLFMELAPTNDDIWFWLMAVKNGYRVNYIKNPTPEPKYIEGTQEGPALTKINDAGEFLFIKQFRNILDAYPEIEKLLHTEYKRMQELDIIYSTPAKSKDYSYYTSLSESLYPAALCEWYNRITGKFLNLDNPKTFNEKIQWLKLYDSTPLKTRLADKYLVRDWVKEVIGEEYLIPLLGVWDSFDEIDFNALPPKFVLKTNHGCGWNIIVKDIKDFKKDDAKQKLAKWLETNYAYKHGFELQYKDIKPKIIAEQYIENKDNDLNDYKVWCFNGKPEYIMYLSERQTGLKMAFYDLDWNPQPFVYSYPKYEKPVPKPDNLDELISIAGKLCEGFPHVRVDFYRLDDGTYKFGEMTFTSFSGVCKWNPEEYELILGQKIILPIKE